MAENSTILGTLGTISFWGTVGYAGNLAYKRYQTMMAFENTTKGIKTTGITSAAKSANAFVSNADKVGLHNLNLKPINFAITADAKTSIGMKLKNMQPALFSDAHADTLDRIIQKANELTGHTFHIQVGQDDAGKLINMSLMSGDRDMSLGNFAFNNKLQHASTSSGHNIYVSNFINEKFTSDILAGNITSITDTLLKSNTIDYNLAKLQVLEANLGSLRGRVAPRRLRKRIKDTLRFMESSHREINANALMHEIHTKHLLTPIVREQGGIATLKVNNEKVRDFGTKLHNLLNQNKLSGSQFLGPDSLAVSQFTNPYTVDSLAQEYFNVFGMRPEGKAVLQAYGRDIRVNNFSQLFPSTNQASLETFLHKTNTKMTNTLYVKPNDEFWRNILAQGYGNKGIPMADVRGKEGTLITKALANEQFSKQHAFTLNLKDKGYYATKELETLLNEIAFVGSKHTSYRNTILESNLSIQQKEIRNNIIIELTNKPEKMQKTLKEMGGKNGLNLYDYFGRKNTTLLRDETGAVTTGDHPSLFLKDLSRTQSGIQLNTDINYTFADTMKIWGEYKELAVGTMQNEDAIFMYLLGEQNPTIKNAIMTNSPKDRTKFLKQLKKQHKDLWKSIPKAMQVVHDDPRKAFATFSTKYMEDIATNLPDTHPLKQHIVEGRFKSALTSIDLSGSFYGIGLNERHASNMIQIDRLRATGQTVAAGVLEGQMREQLQQLTNIYDTFTPMFGDPSSHHVKLDAKYLTDEVLEKMYGPSRTEAFNEAKRVAERMMNVKNVSDKTRFYIEVAGENSIKYRVPIPFVDSPFTMDINDFHYISEGEPLLKRMSSLSRQAVIAARDSTGGFRSIHKEMISEWNSTVMNPTAFTTAMTEGTMAGTVAHEDILSSAALEDILKNNPSMKRDALEGVLNKYDLSLDVNSPNFIDRQPLKGMSSKRFEIATANMKGGDRLKDSWFISTRHPSYAAEGTTLSRAIPLDMLNTDIYGLIGIDPKQIPKVSNRFVHTTPYLNEKLPADLDNDTITMTPILDEATRNEAVRQYKTRNLFLDTINDPKGILKIKNKIGGVAANEYEKAVVEKMGISRAYTGSLIYGMPYNNIPELMGGTEAIRQQKALSLNAFFTNLPENFIGGKWTETEVGSKRILSLFDKQIEPKVRAETLMDISKDITFKRANPAIGITQDMVDKPVFEHLFQGETGLKELTSVFAKGDEATPELVAYLEKRLDGFGGMAGLMKELQHRGMGGGVSDHNMATDTLFRAAEASRGKLSLTMETLSDFAQDVIPRVAKNRTVQGLAAASLLAGLVLQSPDSHIKHQQVREESRPKEIPSPAQAIDAPSGLVSRPNSRGYKMTVKGQLPSGVSPQVLNSQLGEMGMVSRGSYINKNNNIDSSYLKQLQDEEKYNKWNG